MDVTSQVIDAIMRSRVWQSTAILVTWDDAGNVTDHVTPPIVLGSPAGTVLRYGERVASTRGGIEAVADLGGIDGDMDIEPGAPEPGRHRKLGGDVLGHEVHPVDVFAEDRQCAGGHRGADQVARARLSRRNR